VSGFDVRNAIFNPDVARIRGVPLQGTRERSRTHVLQTLDNKANGRVGFARKGEKFRKNLLKLIGSNCYQRI
jgi:hypothetical protein